MTDRAAMNAVSLGELAAFSPRERSLSVTLEVFAYAVLIAFALLLRLAELDRVPMSSAEAMQALSAYRAVTPEATIAPALTARPLLEAVQSMSFGLLGGSELASRVLTVFGSLALILSPMLFRSLLGRGRAFILSVMLTVSPVLFAASRSSSPALWSSLLAVIGLWGIWQFAHVRLRLDDLMAGQSRIDASQGNAYGVIAVVAFGMLTFLSEPGGIILMLILIAAGLVTVFTAPRENQDVYAYEDEESPDEPAVFSIDMLRAFPWLAGIGTAILVIVLISTGFMTQTDGVSGVGEVLSGFLRGFSSGEHPALIPVSVTVFYETFTVLFAIAAVFAMARRRLDSVTRFLIAWVGVALIASALWRGAAPDHALWLILPLIVLASHAVSSLLVDLPDNHLWRVPEWGRWLVALGGLAIFAVFTVAFHDVARTLLFSFDGTLTNIQFTPEGAVLTLIPVLFTIITYFLVASVWGDRAALQGLALGLFVFMVISTVGSGWRIAVTKSDAPNELFHSQEAVSRDIWLMRQTLLDVARWGASEFNDIEVRAIAEPDSIVAWMLRDFKNASYYRDQRDTLYAPIIITPDFGTDLMPEITNNYVGQDFVIRTFWEPNVVLLTELPGWWTQNDTRDEKTAFERVIVWVRSDVYAGTSTEADAAG